MSQGDNLNLSTTTDSRAMSRIEMDLIAAASQSGTLINQCWLSLRRLQVQALLGPCTPRLLEKAVEKPDSDLLGAT